jgi:dTDP-4-dehydrorhamnose reductase
MRLLVTGAQGQLGQSLSVLLNGSDFYESLFLSRLDLDISQKADVFSCIESYRPDVIINAAAYTAVDLAETEKDKAMAFNAAGPTNLAEAARKFDAVVLHVSTDYVFSGDKDGPYLESDKVDPQSVYGETKLAGELAVARACDKHIILRTSWVFSEFGNNFVKTMVRLAKERDELSIVADQLGGPTYAGDIAKTLISIVDEYRLGQKVEWGVYHFGGFPHVSWSDFAKEIFSKSVDCSLIAKEPNVSEINTIDYPAPASRPLNSALDCSKLKANFGISYGDWTVGLSKVLVHLKESEE